LKPQRVLASLERVDFGYATRRVSPSVVDRPSSPSQGPGTFRRSRLPKVRQVSPVPRACACVPPSGEEPAHGTWLALAFGAATATRRARPLQRLLCGHVPGTVPGTCPTRAIP
jgi:hypothetical protein